MKMWSSINNVPIRIFRKVFGLSKLKDISALLLFLLLFSFFLRLTAVTYGSVADPPSVEPHAIFPVIDGDNEMLYFGAFPKGFTLEGFNTTCIFNSVFPVSGDININDGTLTLSRDLVFIGGTTINSLGTIYGLNNKISFPSTLTELSSGVSAVFDSVELFINGDLAVNDRLDFLGSCTIFGQGNLLTLESSGELVVRPGSDLTLQDLYVKKLDSTNLRCMGNVALLFLKDTVLELFDDFTFTSGAMMFSGDVVISGTNKFSYETDQVSRGMENSNLVLDSDLTFSYAPISSNSDLLVLTTSTARLTLNGVTLHATTTGMEIKIGELFVNRKSILSSEATNKLEGIIFGDGVSDNNLTVNFAPAALLELTAGYLVNENLE